MDVRIGVTYSGKELEVEMGSDADQDALRKDVEKAVGSKEGVLWLTDKRGRSVGVPADKIAYVELAAESGERRIGFVG